MADAEDIIDRRTNEEVLRRAKVQKRLLPTIQKRTLDFLAYRATTPDSTEKEMEKEKEDCALHC